MQVDKWANVLAEQDQSKLTNTQLKLALILDIK